MTKNEKKQLAEKYNDNNKNYENNSDDHTSPRLWVVQQLVPVMNFVLCPKAGDSVSARDEEEEHNVNNVKKSTTTTEKLDCIYIF